MVLIRKLAAPDIKRIASLHRKYLREGIIAKLGQDFLEDFYKVTLNQKSVFTLVAVEENDIVGFVTGAVHLKAVPQIMLRALAKSVLISVVKNPQILPKLIQIPFYPSFAKNNNFGEIFSIVVTAQKRGQGIGSHLIRACCQEFRKRKCRLFVLSARKSMKDTSVFYEKVGLKKEKTVKFLGEKIVFWKGIC